MTKKIKVLLVLPTLEQGGGQKFVIDLANGLDKRKFEVKILAFYAKTGSIFDRFAEDNGLDVVYLDKQVGLDFSMFTKVWREVRRYSPDVIHSNLDTMLYLLPSYRAKQTKLHTMHSLAEKEATGLQRLVRKIAFSVMGVQPVAISNVVAESICTVYGMEHHRFPLVYNGVVCSRYDLPRKPADTLRLISVGSLYEVKNFSFLIRCFAAARQIIGNMHLTLVGDGVQRKELEEQICQLNLEQDVTLTGTVANVEEYLADADIYVASSLYEGLPISMLEAMAAGLPIISTNVGGVPDVVQHRTNGLLVESGDQDAYVAAISELVENKKLRNLYAQAAKEMAKQFDISHMITGYECLYEKK